MAARYPLESLVMRRFLILFLVFLLPLQVSWAVAANYCGHEQEKSANHFGHHQDEHQSSPDNNKPADDKLSFNHDHNHLSGYLGMLLNEPLITGRPTPQMERQRDELSFASLLPEQPERPKWNSPA